MAKSKKRKLFPYGYRPTVRLINNKVLNVFLDAIVSMIRGICNIIDGLVLLLTFGQFFTALGYKVVILISKHRKDK